MWLGGLKTQELKRQENERLENKHCYNRVAQSRSEGWREFGNNSK